MELDQTLLLRKNLFFHPKLAVSTLELDPRRTLSVPQSSLSSEPTSTKRNNRFSLGNWSLKCSLDYYNSNKTNNDNHEGVVGPQHYPRPSDIQWKKELCNSVQLIGNVAMPVQVKHLPSGKALAWTRLAVKKSQTETTWINLTFWDELAHTAFQHVEKGQQIYVSGRLVSDTVENDDRKQQTYYKVVVQQLNFIERNFSPIALYDADSNSVTPGRNYGNRISYSTGSIEELWQAFFANPVEWWDNRKNKKSPNYPDFKHKDTGEALWIEGRKNPSWVKSQLAILDSRMESFHDQNASMQIDFMADDNFTPS